MKYYYYEYSEENWIYLNLSCKLNTILADILYSKIINENCTKQSLISFIICVSSENSSLISIYSYSFLFYNNITIDKIVVIIPKLILFQCFSISISLKTTIPINIDHIELNWTIIVTIEAGNCLYANAWKNDAK